jgi:PAS domain S-box-containing protein
MFDYQDLYSDAPVGLCVLKNRTFVQCNRQFEEIFGYGHGELTGRSVLVLYPSKAMFDHIGAKYGHFFEREDFYRDERPMTRKDGSLMWCMITGKAVDSANPRQGQAWVVQDLSGHKRTEESLKENVEKLELMVRQRTIELRRHINNLNIEVATRKAAEKNAHELQHKFQSVFRITPVGISLTDADGNILEANDVFRETIGGGGVGGRNWTHIGARFWLADGTQLPAGRVPWLIAGMAQGALNSVEVGMRKKRRGKRRWLNVSSSQLMLKGSPVILTVFTDITYRKHIEELERLRYAELTRLGRINSMAEMSATLAHQLGQPLVSALNYLHGCRLRLQHIDGTAEISGSVMRSIEHLEQAGEILRRVRDFVCRHQPDKAPEALNGIIQDTISFLDFEFRREGVAVDLCLAPDLPPVPLCKIEIQQVLFNLLKNGIEAMSGLPAQERRLLVGSRLCPDGREVAVFVEDRGRATVRGRTSKLFQPLYTTKPDGIGIGLTICRCVVESHGGKLLFVRSGRTGSRLEFTLPLQDTDAPPR